MGMTSAAEANLDARVRPQIVAMRSRTSYPKRRQADAVQPRAVSAPAQIDTPAPMSPALGSDALGSDALGSDAPGSDAPGSDAPGSDAPGSRPAAAQPSPIRLTRRGRIVVGTLIGIGVAAVAGLIWFAVAGQAQASSQLGPGAPAGNSVLRVVVKPGETLWEIAAQADPAADPRAVISQIEEFNALSGTTIMAGQVLWVPRG
ncbi:MAG TPA: LysM peptidoglycan-binding domain-containing protein [Streptosporangiaceae bacterium]|nr:LysM peptidoglycan-binding domain-containing protein [Streptosporangiaceae bacterium]